MITKSHNYWCLILFAIFALTLNSCSKDNNNKDTEEEAAPPGDYFMKFKLNGEELDYSDFSSATMNAIDKDDGYYSTILIGVHQNESTTATSNIAIDISSIFDINNEKIKEGTYTNPAIYKIILDEDGFPIHPYPYILVTFSDATHPTIAHLGLSATVTLTSITEKEVVGTFSAELSTGTDTKVVTDVITDGKFKLKRDK